MKDTPDLLPDANKLRTVITTAMQKAVQDLTGGAKGTCQIEFCPNDALAKGLCNAHYIRARRNLTMEAPVQSTMGTCMDCHQTIGGKGGWMRCAKHFKLARQQTIKTALVEAMGGCCQICYGIFPNAVYDFHHIGGKENDPSYAIANSSIDKISQELSKCVLLCANCHRIKHET